MKAIVRYTDGRGLMLDIGKDGSRKWVMRVQYGGRGRDIGLGSEPTAPLASAPIGATNLKTHLQCWQFLIVGHIVDKTRLLLVNSFHINCLDDNSGGWGGIRTHETLSRLPVFKTGAFNHSATHPWLETDAA